MAAKAWTCKCGCLNDPSDEGFSTSKCISCGKNRFVIYYIIGIGVGGLILIVSLISILSGLPGKKYREAIRKAYRDKVISSGEQKELDLLAKRYQIPKEKREKWLKEVMGEEGPPPPPPPPPPPTDEPPPMAMQHMQNGLNYVKQRDFENAVIEFNLAIEAYPRYAAAYGNRGEANKQLKKYNKAEEDLEKAVELDPKGKYIHYNLAGLYCIQRKLDLTLDELDKALALDELDQQKGFGNDNYDIFKTDQDLGNCRQDAKCREDLRKVLEKHKIFIIR